MKLIHLTKQGFLDLLQLFIILNNKFNCSNNLISYILLCMGQLRNSSYIVFSHFAKQSEHDQIYQMISYFSRPHLVAYTKYLFFASFAFILVIYFTLIYQVIAYQCTRTQTIKEKNSLQQFLFYQKRLIQVLNKLIAIIYANYEFIIINFLFEISLVEFQNYQTFYQVIIIIQLFLYTLFASTKLIINQQKLSLSSNISSKFFFTNFEVTLHCMNYVQIFSYCFLEENQLLQTVITLLISIIQLASICTFYHFMNQKAYRIIIVCQSYALILSISDLIIYFTQYTQNDLGIFSFITFPLLLAAINEYHQQSMILKLYDKQSNNLVKFQLLFSNFKHQQESKSQCYEFFIYKTHKLSCSNCACSEKLILNDVYLNLIEEHVSQKNLKDKSIIIYILVLLFSENYIQAYSICSSIIENHFHLSNDHLSIKYIMKNSSGAIIQPLHQKDNDQRLCHVIQSLIMDYLRSESKQMVKQRLQSNKLICDQAMHTFEEFYKTEYRIRLLNMQIVKILMMKQNLHKEIARKKNRNQIFEASYKVAYKILITQQNLDDLYKENPTISVINLRVFYQTEILNNYLQASKDHSIVYEMDVLRSKNILFLIQDNKATFLITKLHNCSYNIEIERAASNAQEFFQSEIPRYIEPLIPKAIRDFHGDNLHDFFQTGNSPRYKQTARIFIMQNNFIQIAESYLDTYEIQQELKFINIIQDVKDIKGYMILNNKCEISGMNRSFLGLLNYTRSQIEAFKPQDVIIGLNINYLIPSFSLLVTENRAITQIECFFPKQSSLFQQSRTLLSERFTTTEQLDRYETLIEIEYKYHHNELAYIIITFDYFKKLYSSSMTSNFYDQSIRTVQIPQLFCFTQKFEEDILLEPPYDFISSENQRQETTPMFTLKFLHSPFLLEKSSTYEVGPQQKFFHRSDEQEMDSEEVSILKKGVKKQTTVLYQQLETKRDESKMDMTTPRIQKEHENRSDYWDKIVFIDKIANKRINNTNVGFAICFLIFSSILGVISLMMQTLLIQNNFANYIDDVSHLQIRSDLIQPLLSFYVLRFIIYDKMIQLNSDELSLEDYNIQTKFVFEHMQPQYQLFHDNVAKFFVSSVLQEEVLTYYENIKIYIDSGEYDYQNMSMRTFLMQLLEYQQFLYIVYSSNTIPILNGCVQFQFMNYKKLIKLGSYLSQKVYSNTLKRNTSQVQDQIIIIVCFLTVNFICLLFSYHYFRNFAKQKQLISSLLLNIDDRAFQQEIDYCQYLIDEIEHNNISQYYSFKEKQKIQEIKDLDVQAKIHQDQQMKFQNQAAQVPTSKFLLYIYTMFIGFLGINLANTLILSEFISSYEPTARLYQNTSDLCVSMAIMFAFREILNNKVFYKYLLQSDFDYYYDEIEASLNQIQAFSQALLYQQNWNMLFNSYFLDYFLNQQTSNLCPLINKDNLTDIEYICESALSGSLKMGLQGVLNQITKSFITDMGDFKITTRKSTNIIEIQGSFLFTEYLRNATDMAMADFSIEVLHYKSILESILIIAIIVTFMLIVIITFVLQYQLKPQLDVASKFIHLIPRQALFLDNAFERRAKLAFLNDPWA